MANLGGFGQNITDVTSGSGAVAGQLPGVTPGAVIGSGYIGQIVNSSVPIGSAVALTTGTAANVTSISLPAGNWLIFGEVQYNIAGTTVVTFLQGGTSSTSATFGTPDTYSSSSFPAGYVPGGRVTKVFPTTPVSLATTTTYYLVATSNFSASTNSAYGSITAIRIS